MESLHRRGSFAEPDSKFFKYIFWKYSNVMEECMSQSTAMSIWAQETLGRILEKFSFANLAERIYYAYKFSSLFFSNMAYAMVPCRTDWEKCNSWEDLEKSFPVFCFKSFSFQEIKNFVLEKLPLDNIDSILLPPEYVRFSSQATIVGDRLFFWSSLGSCMELKDSKSTYGHATLLKNLQVYENVTQTVPIIDINSRIVYSKWIQQWMCRMGKVWCILYGRQCDRIDFGILKFASFPADDSVVKSSKYTFQCPFLSYVKQSILLRGVGFDSFSRLDSKNTQCYMLPSHWKECMDVTDDIKVKEEKKETRKLSLPPPKIKTEPELEICLKKIKITALVDTTFTFGWIKNDSDQVPDSDTFKTIEITKPEPLMAPSIDWMSQMSTLNMFSGIAAFRTTVNDFRTNVYDLKTRD